MRGRLQFTSNSKKLIFFYSISLPCAIPKPGFPFLPLDNTTSRFIAFSCLTFWFYFPLQQGGSIQLLSPNVIILPQPIFNLQNKDFQIRSGAMEEEKESCYLFSEEKVSITQDGDILGIGYTTCRCLTVLYCAPGRMNFICGFTFFASIKIKDYLLNILRKSLDESYLVTQNMPLNSNPHPTILIKIILQKIIILPNTCDIVFKRKSDE